MRNATSKCPWARDSLSKYVDSLIQGVRAAYCRRDKSYASLAEVHEYFSAVIKDLAVTNSIPSSFLVARSHASYLAAVTLLLGGQTADCYALLRSCIESALYAFFLHNHPERVRTWVDRHKSESHLRACKKQFQIANIMKALEEVDPAAKKYVGALYDRAIDCGAHPNMLSVFSRVRKGRKPNSYIFSYQSTDKLVRQCAAYDAVHVGLVALTLVSVTFPDELDIPCLKKGIMDICKSTSATNRRCSRKLGLSRSAQRTARVSTPLV